MASLDDLKAAANAGKEKALGAFNSLRSGPVSTGGAPGAAVNYDTPTVLRNQAPLPAATPVEEGAVPRTAGTGRYAPGSSYASDAGYRSSINARMASGGGASVPPPVTPTAATPGIVGRAGSVAGRAISTAGRVAPVVAGALEGVNTYNDVSTPGMGGLDSVARVGEGVGRVAGATAGAALGATAGSVVPVVGNAVGGILGGVAGYMAPDLVNKAVNYATGTNTQLPSERAASLRAAAVPAASATPAGPLPTATQQNAGATTAPTPMAAMPAQPVADPGGLQATRLSAGQAGNVARGIRSGAISLPTEPGTGYVVASDGSGGTQFTQRPAVNAPATPSNPRADAIESLRAAATQDFGDPLVGRRGRRDAANQLLDYYAKDDANNISRASAYATIGKNMSEMDDKRVKDFNDQFVNNQFYATSTDKNGNVKSEPDQARNAAFLDFARRVDPRFATSQGIAQLSNLPAQDRNQLVTDIRKKFVEKEQVEAATNKNTWFTPPGLSNAPVSVGSAREATVGDIPQIGLGNYLYSNLPFTDRNVVDTDRGAVPAQEYIGDGTTEGSLDRRRRIYGSK